MTLNTFTSGINTSFSTELNENFTHVITGGYTISPAIASSTASSNSIFQDSSDSVLKVKDENSEVFPIVPGIVKLYEKSSGWVAGSDISVSVDSTVYYGYKISFAVESTTTTGHSFFIKVNNSGSTYTSQYITSAAALFSTSTTFGSETTTDGIRLHPGGTMAFTSDSACTETTIFSGVSAYLQTGVFNRDPTGSPTVYSAIGGDQPITAAITSLDINLTGAATSQPTIIIYGLRR